MEVNTHYQLSALAVKDVPLLETAQAILNVSDLLNQWLTGRDVCEFISATSTWCRDPRRHEWAFSMADPTGIPTHVLPEVPPA